MVCCLGKIVSVGFMQIGRVRVFAWMFIGPAAAVSLKEEGIFSETSNANVDKVMDVKARRNLCKHLPKAFPSHCCGRCSQAGC